MLFSEMDLKPELVDALTRMKNHEANGYSSGEYSQNPAWGPFFRPSTNGFRKNACLLYPSCTDDRSE